MKNPEGAKIKVGIMGAGLSGLACALVLEANGIEPVIFEQRSQIGDRFVNGEVLLSILSRPVIDCLAYFSDEHGIFLKPVSNLKRMIIHSQNEQAVINGHLGFANLRGRHPDAFENQLARQVKSRIVFNSQYRYEELVQDFTHVVMATGDAAYAAKVQNYQVDLTVTLKGVNVVGDFDRYSVAVWLDHRLAPKGYGYLIPLSDKQANLVIAYPDYPENREQDINDLWAAFFRRACRDLKQNPKIIDHFEVTRYIIGICRQPRIGNTFFTGNCFGAIMPFLGFGQFVSILTGIYAAHDLCGRGSYAELTRPLRRSYQNSLILRRAMEQLDNAKFDLLVKNLNGFWGDKLFNSGSYDVLKLFSYLLRPWLQMKRIVN